MSPPLTAAEIRAAFKHWHVPYYEVPGWESRSNGNWFKDITGLMYHHTAGSGSDKQERGIITNGHASLSGPLANFGVRDDGVIDIIARGCANHAGGGDPDVLAAVRKESYTHYPPKTDKHHNESGSVGGNSYFMGWESYYGGPGDPTVNALQHRVTILSMAAMTWALAKKSGITWTSKSTIGHKEWSDWKPDPAGVDMKDARRQIQWCLDNGPDAAYAWYKTGKQTTGVPVAQTQRAYRGRTQAAKDAVQAFLSSDAIDAPNSDPKNPYWNGATWTKYMGRWVRQIYIWTNDQQGVLKQISEDVKAIRALLEKKETP